MRHRLIMVSGSSPGAGKSTLAAALARRFACQGAPCRLLSEDDLLRRDGFARFDRELGANDPHAIDALLAAARALALEGAGSGETRITDALLPGFFWLCGRYPPERVAAFGDDLATVLSPLRPLIVHLDADIATALGRAGAVRGAGWPERMSGAARRWNLPSYPGPAPRDLDDIVRFFAWLNDEMKRLFVRWPGPTRLLQATATPVEVLAQEILPEI